MHARRMLLFSRAIRSALLLSPHLMGWVVRATNGDAWPWRMCTMPAPAPSPGPRLALQTLTRRMRAAIEEQRFPDWTRSYLTNMFPKVREAARKPPPHPSSAPSALLLHCAVLAKLGGRRLLQLQRSTCSCMHALRGRHDPAACCAALRVGRRAALGARGDGRGGHLTRRRGDYAAERDGEGAAAQAGHGHGGMSHAHTHTC